MFFPNGNVTYLELKSLIISQPESAEALLEMKTLYREDIKSIRLEDRIETVSDLIKVLERRDLINEGNIAPLEKIYSILNKSLPYNPQYISTRSRTLAPNILISNSYSRSAKVPCDLEVKAKVYETIASQIGRNWTSFARNLCLPERLIDDLFHKTSKDRVYDILHFHEDNCDIRRWKTDLSKALIECRRRDLYEKVHSIFDTYKI